MELNSLIEKVKAGGPKKVAVVAPQDANVLKSVFDAYKLGITIPILCGDIEQIDMVARLNNIDISQFEIIEADNDIQAASIAVSLVKTGRAQMLMKGILHSADFLRAVLNKENGLRTGNILSHVGVAYSESHKRSWILTDGAMLMYPDLKTKVKLIENAVAFAHDLGIENPKVAPLAAIEVVNPEMQATLDASALAMMSSRGQIKGCIVDGPLAFDVAVSADAAKHKGISSPAAGCADILLFHNIEAANSTVKAMTNIAGCLFGGAVIGASAPIVLTSRSDSEASKLYSIALAAASNTSPQ